MIPLKFKTTKLNFHLLSKVLKVGGGEYKAGVSMGVSMRVRLAYMGTHSLHSMYAYLYHKKLNEV